MRHLQALYHALRTCGERVEKSWGVEQILCNNEQANYCAKLLILRPGEITSWHAHGTKHETFIALSDSVRVNLYPQGIAPDGEHYAKLIVKIGEEVIIKPHTVHQLINHDLDKCIRVLEISNYHSDLDTLRY
jgi:mannose-6-phosphate isomerase-like protein (cupin superfamily)